jgi:hypothetical protein
MDRGSLAYLFDPDFYRASNPQLGSRGDRALEKHFLAVGGPAGLSPHPLFSPAHYTSQVAGLAVGEAAVHYLQVGAASGLSPHPLFDPAYYQLQAGPKDDPLHDYLSEGWRAGLDPHPLFSVDYYLVHAPDVGTADLEPLTHYVMFGGRELRVHHPMFDPEFYTERVGYQLGAEAPLMHYLRTGGLVDPSPHFSTVHYLASSDDARTSHLPPLAHWLTIGAPQLLPPSSRPLPEVATELLLSGDVLGASLALGYARSDYRGFPLRATGISFEFAESEVDEIAGGQLIGGLPGLLRDGNRLVGAVPPGRPLTIVHDLLASIVRPDRGLVSAVISSGEPLEDVLVPEVPMEASERHWLLRVVPSAWERIHLDSTRRLALTTDPPSRGLISRILGLDNVVHIAAGNVVEFRRATIVRASDEPLAALRSSMWHGAAESERRGVVLVVHPDDPFDEIGRSLLATSVLDAGGLIVDARWGLEVLRSALARAKTVYAAGGLPHAALLAAPATRLVALVATAPDWLATLDSSGIQVDLVALPPNANSANQIPSSLLDVKPAVEHIQAGE